MLKALVTGLRGNRWFSLIDKIYRAETLRLAWAKVQSNAGGSGVDGITVERFEKTCPNGLLVLKKQLQAAVLPTQVRQTGRDSKATDSGPDVVAKPKVAQPLLRQAGLVQSHASSRRSLSVSLKGATHQLVSRMPEIGPSGSEGGAGPIPIGANLTNDPFPWIFRKLRTPSSAPFFQFRANRRTMSYQLPRPQWSTHHRYDRVARLNKLTPVARRQAIDIPRGKKTSPRASAARSADHRATSPGSRPGRKLHHI